MSGIVSKNFLGNQGVSGDEGEYNEASPTPNIKRQNLVSFLLFCLIKWKLLDYNSSNGNIWGFSRPNNSVILAKKHLWIAYLSLFSLIVLAQGNIDEAAMDLDGAVDVQKRGANGVAAIKTYDFLERSKRCECDPICPC